MEQQQELLQELQEPRPNPFNKPDFPCSACTLYDAPGPVRGTGNRAARILYLGEAPGAEEVDFPRHRPERFAPFVGGAGRIRNAMLGHAGLVHQAHMFTTNVVKCRPPDNRLPTKHEIACCAKFLIEEIEDVNPNVIIAAGEVALNTVADKEKIGNWRGVVCAGPARKDGPPYKVFPTWHPAFIARAQHNWAFAVHDLVRAKQESEFPEIRRVPFELIRRGSYEAHGASILADARARGACTFDFETSGLSPEYDSILMCGFVARPEQGIVLDWTTGTQRLFQEILDDPTIEVVGQNILYYDLPFAEAKGFRIRWSKVFDTMVAFHLANASYGQSTLSQQKKGQSARGAEKDLSFIASNHTDIEYWKTKQAYKNDLYGVCGLDVIATDRSALSPTEGLKAELKSLDMLDLYYKHVLPVHGPLHRMTKRGVKIDEELAAKWSIVLLRQADALEVALKEGLGNPSLNLDSPVQLMDLLYNKLGLPVQYLMDKKKGMRRPTANADAIQALAELAPENKILGAIVDIRHLRKMESTFVRPGLLRGRLHPRFGVSKAANGRMNSQEPNGQNVPEEMRDIWIPDSPEHVLISADSSQIEWRIAMVLSGDPVGLELLASGVDNHRAVAAEALGKPLDEVTDHERHGAKFIVYGLGYGRGAASIAEGHGLDLKWTQSFIRRFFARFNVFHGWRESLTGIVKNQHYLVNPFKRRRWWYTWEITEIYNFPASSTAADMMYEEIIMLDEQLPKGAELRMTVHDEVVVHAHRDVAREAVACIKEVMQAKWPLIVDASARPENVKRFYPTGWFCPADVHVGTNWKMCKSKDPRDKIARATLEQQLGLQKRTA